MVLQRPVELARLTGSWQLTAGQIAPEDNFRVADYTPGIIAAANGTFVGLRDHDQPASVYVALPGILDLGERNTLGLNAQFAARCVLHHLLERLGEHVPRRNARRS